MTEIYHLIEVNGPGVLIILAILLFGKKLIEYFFDQTIELKKTELNQKLEEYKLSLEEKSKEFQHELDTKLQHFNIQFSKLHNDRAKVVKELYTKMIELQSSMEDFTRGMHPIVKDAEEEEKQRLERVEKALKDFANYFLPNKIFFNKDLADKVDNLLKEYWNTGWAYALYNKEFKIKGLPRERHSELLDKTREIGDNVKKQLPPLIEELENDFRDILGVK